MIDFLPELVVCALFLTAIALGWHVRRVERARARERFAAAFPGACEVCVLQRWGRAMGLYGAARPHDCKAARS